MKLKRKTFREPYCPVCDGYAVVFVTEYTEDGAGKVSRYGHIGGCPYCRGWGYQIYRDSPWMDWLRQREEQA